MIGYFALFYAISRLTNQFGTTKESYIVANHNAGLVESTLGMMGCWLTGLGLMTSATQFFNNGWVGYFWFTAPQILGMLLFAWMTVKINDRVPNGYTTSEWIRDTFGIGVGGIFQIVFIFACFGNLATTFTAVFKYIKFIEIGNAALITGLIVAGTSLYSFKGGIKTSLLTSSIQTVLNIILMSALAIIGFNALPDTDVGNFLTGKKHITDIIDSTLMITFGITAFLTLITGPMMSATHHQKSYAQQKKQPWKAWAWGAPGYLVLQTIVASLGVLALAWGGTVTDPSIAELEFLKFVGVGSLAIFGVVLLNIACVIIDAHGNAIASIIANDFVKDPTKSLMTARWTMVVVAFVTWLIALQNIDLTYILFTYGVLRVNLFFILIGILFTTLFTRQGIFWTAIVMCPTTVTLGLYAMNTKQPILNVVASCVAMFVTPIIALGMSKLLKNNS